MWNKKVAFWTVCIIKNRASFVQLIQENFWICLAILFAKVKNLKDNNFISVSLVLERRIKKESFFLMTANKKESQTPYAINKIGACKRWGKGNTLSCWELRTFTGCDGENKILFLRVMFECSLLPKRQIKKRWSLFR